MQQSLPAPQTAHPKPYHTVMPSGSDQHHPTNSTSLMGGVLIADRTEAELSRQHY